MKLSLKVSKHVMIGRGIHHPRNEDFQNHLCSEMLNAVPSCSAASQFLGTQLTS